MVNENSVNDKGIKGEWRINRKTANQNKQKEKQRKKNNEGKKSKIANKENCKK